MAQGEYFCRNYWSPADPFTGAFAAVAIVQELHVKEATAALAGCENHNDSPRTSTNVEMVPENMGPES